MIHPSIPVSFHLRKKRKGDVNGVAGGKKAKKETAEEKALRVSFHPNPHVS